MSRHDAQPDDTLDDLRDKLRRARFHELHNYDQWQTAEIRLATLLAEVREIEERAYTGMASNSDVQAGVDLVATWLDVLTTKYEMTK